MGDLAGTVSAQPAAGTQMTGGRKVAACSIGIASFTIFMIRYRIDFFLMIQYF